MISSTTKFAVIERLIRNVRQLAKEVLVIPLHDPESNFALFRVLLIKYADDNRGAPNDCAVLPITEDHLPAGQVVIQDYASLENLIRGGIKHRDT